jgi:toxin YoeB
MKICWTKKSAQDLDFFKKSDQKVCNRIKLLISDIEQDPFKGIGKTEPLKYNFEGCWSRRITGAHRLVYRVKNDRIEILQCRYHY